MNARICSVGRPSFHLPRYGPSPMVRRARARRAHRVRVARLARLRELQAPSIIIEAEENMVRNAVERYNATSRILRLPAWGVGA